MGPRPVYPGLLVFRGFRDLVKRVRFARRNALMLALLVSMTVLAPKLKCLAGSTVLATLRGWRIVQYDN